MAKQRGRPPLVTGTAIRPFSIRVTTAQFDKLCARAAKENATVPDLIRRGVERMLEEEDARKTTKGGNREIVKRARE